MAQVSQKKAPPEDELKHLHRLLTSAGQNLATAESCTGGLLSCWLTEFPGASEYFKGGLIAYSTQVKTEILGLSKEKIQQKGWATKDCAEDMAQGVKKLLQSDWAVAVTGVLGPKTGEKAEPVGQIAFAVVSKNLCQSLVKQFPPAGREHLRRTATLFALQFLISMVKMKIPEGGYVNQKG